MSRLESFKEHNNKAGITKTNSQVSKQWQERRVSKKKHVIFFSCLLYSLVSPEAAQEGADIGQQSQLTPSPCWDPDHLFALHSSSIPSIPHGPV